MKRQQKAAVWMGVAESLCLWVFAANFASLGACIIVDTLIRPVSFLEWASVAGGTIVLFIGITVQWRHMEGESHWWSRCWRPSESSRVGH